LGCTITARAAIANVPALSVGSKTWFVVIHSPIDRPNEHWRRTDLRVSELKMALRVRLRVCDGLHPALQLNKDYVNAGSRLPGGAVAHSSLQRAGPDYRARTGN
jgi:hypothetical protein